jgi:hypothetical protein
MTLRRIRSRSVNLSSLKSIDSKYVVDEVLDHLAVSEVVVENATTNSVSEERILSLNLFSQCRKISFSTVHLRSRRARKRRPTKRKQILESIDPFADKDRSIVGLRLKLRSLLRTLLKDK